MLNELFEQHKATYYSNPYPELHRRREQLIALKKMLQQHAGILSKSVNSDFSHRSTDETLFLELVPSIKSIDYCLKNLKKWTKLRKRQVPWHMKPATAALFPQPLGVVGVMVPWNYPIYLLIVPLAYALAAGNQVMIKCSELSPAIGSTLNQLINEIPCLKNSISIVNGDLACSKLFAALPFAHLLFTGSTAAGRQIMQTASKNLTPVTLELGGKSPVIISTSLKKEHLQRIFMGKLFNAGQTCLAPDYLLVPLELLSVVLEELDHFIACRYPDIINNPDFSHIISQDHLQRLMDLLQDAEQKGAKVTRYGTMSAYSTCMPVCVLENVNKSMRLMQEEIFGPLIPIITYNNFAEVRDIIRSLANPLALYYFGNNQDEINQLQYNTLSGALAINDTVMHIAVEDLPFGGIGESGMGVSHAQEGFDTFSCLKPIFHQKKSLFPFNLFYPPYGKLIRLFVQHYAGIQLKE